MFEGERCQPDDFGATLAAIAQDVAPSVRAVGTLVGCDPARLSPAEQVDLVVGLDRQIQWLTAVQARALAALDDSRPADEDPCGGSEFTRHEVAAALRLSDGVAHSRLTVARQLAGRLQPTWTLLAGGRISYWHAVRVAEATRTLTDDQAAAVQSRVLPKSPGQTTAALARALRRAVIRADPDAAQVAQEKARCERTVDWWALEDGMAYLRMVGPAPQVAAVYTALTGLADRPVCDGDQRPAPARRFDAPYEICADLLACGALPSRHGVRPHINVTLAATTLLGLDERPGELVGYGPITADTARRIAADGTWRRLLHDPVDGRLLHYGRSTYTPPADLQRHIIARDRTCCFPHCTQSAWRCDIDHAQPWDRGGCTDSDNCGALCRRHHRAKTVGGWQLTRQPDDACVWTSPAGHKYTVHPPPYGDHP